MSDGVAENVKKDTGLISRAYSSDEAKERMKQNFSKRQALNGVVNSCGGVVR